MEICINIDILNFYTSINNVLILFYIVLFIILLKIENSRYYSAVLFSVGFFLRLVLLRLKVG